jgi:Tfp pilus assembly protein PilF
MTLSTLGVADSSYIDAFFSSNTTYSQTQLDSLANNSLSQGIDYYQNGNYDQAINAFKRSAGLAPFTDNSAKAYDYIAQSYLKQDKTEQAIRTYKYAIGIYPVRDDLHLALGDIYAKEGSQDEALKEYEAAVRFNPNSNQNRYSLGQSYLSTGQLDAAREQFQAVVNLSPSSATGYFGLGQVARAQGDFQGAVSQFQKAISVNKDFLNSYRDLGYAYADLGDFQRAGDQLAILSAKNSAEATNLQNYMAQADTPKINSVSICDGFNTSLGPKTSISKLNANLATPGSTKIFSMNFVFSKEMDPASVSNPYNWSITRASIEKNGGVYNGGLSIPRTEAIVNPNPINIIYNADTTTATISFRVAQNVNGNATLDPKHIVFKFSGVDAYSKAMDSSADEYSGFSHIA